MLLVDGGWRDRYKTRGIKLWSCLSGREKRGGLGRRPGRRTRIGGKRGRRTWLLLKTTAPSKRSSAAWTRSSTPALLLRKYPILPILFTRLSSRFLSSFLAKPHQAGEAYKSRAKVVALATSCRAVGGRPCALRTRRA